MGGEEGAGAAGAGDHFVEDQQDAVAGADVADSGDVGVGRDEGAGGEAADRLHDEGEDGGRVFGEDAGLERVGAMACVGFGRVIERQAVGEGGGDERHFRHHRAVERVGDRVAGDGECGEGVAVIAGLAADHLPAPGLTGDDGVLAAEF